MKSKDFLEKQHKENRKIYKGKKPKVTVPKSDHKHVYFDCLIINKEKSSLNDSGFIERCYKAKYCTICGKIDDIKWFETERVEGEKSYRLLSSRPQEMQARHPQLITFIVNDIHKDKFVKITPQ